MLIGSNVHIEPIYDGDEVSRAMMAAVQEAFETTSRPRIRWSRGKIRWSGHPRMGEKYPVNLPGRLRTDQLAPARPNSRPIADVDLSGQVDQSHDHPGGTKDLAHGTDRFPVHISPQVRGWTTT